MGFKKRLLRGPWIRPMEGRAAGHRPHREHLQLDPLPVQIGIRFVPIDLRLDAPVVALRNERLVTTRPSSCLRRSTYCRTVRSAGVHPGISAANAIVDPPRRMALLARSLRSDSRIASINATAGAIFTDGRSVFFRRAGTAFRTASRTMRRCTPSFRATPITDPTPNSYSRRICSYSSTLALQSNSPPSLNSAENRVESALPKGGPT